MGGKMISKIRRFRFALMVAALLLLVMGWQTWAAQISTGARCTSGADCNIGSTRIGGMTLTTNGATLNVEGTTAETLTLTATSTNTAVFQGADAAGASNTTLDTTGAGAIIVGSADVTNVTIDSDVGITFANNADSINNLADDVFDFTRNDAGIVTFTCSDDNAVAGCTYDAGGASPIVIGSADVTNVTLDSDVGLTFAENDEAISNPNDGEILFTREEAGIVTLNFADDSSPVTGVTIDATGAAPFVFGSADVTQHTFLSDSFGGSVVIDGSVLAQVPAVANSGGALALNTITLATAAADYDLPATSCAGASDVGNWVTIVIEDDTTLVSITSDDVNNVFNVPGLDIAAGRELDNVTTAAHEGQNITLTCMAQDQWYMTAGSLNLAGAATIAWADGGAAD